MLKKFLAKRKEKQCLRGFSWAATELLLGSDVNILRQEVYQTAYMKERTPFDDGAIDALKRWEELMGCSSLMSK